MPIPSKKQFIHFKNAKEREPKEINTSKLKQVFALIFITGLDNNVCPRQVKCVGHLSVGTSRKKNQLRQERMIRPSSTFIQYL